ncbi:recombination protein NinB [Bradyrhizobium cenepequi]|uniref:recombination protein NinB n=1 Tax=Bradyrhizobium cenepequi TaxID=2821403 RepID=UPI001CE2E671|nr:recombination protein NinB [Bradyrhizobium cenepequi]MCA6108167.1 recombination protein NinB [Bradyrhizobium cenepequi]
MSQRAVLTILSVVDRQKAREILESAPIGSRLEVRAAPARSLKQNDLMWGRLADIANQVVWHGQKLTDQDWKDVLTASMRRAKIVPNIDGDGFVQIGYRTSQFTTPEMTMFLDLIDAFGTQQGVKFTDIERQLNSYGQQSQTAANHDEARTDQPAAATGEAGAAAGTIPEREPGDEGLSDDWRHTYLTCMMNRRDKAMSLHSRHAEAIQMVGGTPRARELAWMRLAWRAVEHRNKGKMKPGEFDAKLTELLSMPLPDEDAGK